MSRRRRGIEVYASQFGVSTAEAERIFTERYGERMAEEAFNAQGGSTWEADALSLRDRSLIVLAALITQGGVESRLRQHVRWALELEPQIRRAYETWDNPEWIDFAIRNVHRRGTDRQA